MERGKEPLFYKSSQACKILGVKDGILKKWDAEGKINVLRTPGGMRLYDIASVDPSAKLFKIQKNTNDRSIILYSRVSSAKQKDDLERQEHFLKENLPDEYSGSKQIQTISDVGSGINFKRPGLLRILGLVKEGKVSTVVVASKDRLARFGFELIEWLCKEFGAKILVLDAKDTSPEAELGNDLMAIVQVYCCRWNGRRRYASNKVKSEKAKIESDEESEDSLE
jgi:predicted site-specific integrase-resolvase